MSDAASCLPEALRASVAILATECSARHVRALAIELGKADGPGPSAVRRAVEAVPLPDVRAALQALCEAWLSAPAVTSAALSAALLAAAETAERLRSSGALEIVWTGPGSREVPVRMTLEVVMDLITAAYHSIVLLSYAAYRVAPVVNALADAVSRGVDVRLILESSEASSGRLSDDASRAFEGLLGKVRLFEWKDRRRDDSARSDALMHAKGLIVDDSVALVTSANFTGAAMERNMELGLLVRGGTVPARLGAHFRALIAEGTLGEVR